MPSQAINKRNITMPQTSPLNIGHKFNVHRLRNLRKVWVGFGWVNTSYKKMNVRSLLGIKNN